MRIRNATCIALGLLVVLGAAGCDKGEAPSGSAAAPDAHPVKNVESLPAGTIREGARTMNRGADMGQNLEQQKQDRDKEIDAQSR